MPTNRVHAWSKRATALILAGAVAASSAMGSFAPAAYAALGQGSVTITSAQGAQTEYDVYRFFKAEVSNENKASHVDWALTPEQRTKLIEEFLGQDYVDWLTGKKMDEDAGTLAQNALEYISANIAASTGKTGEDPKWVDANTFAMNLATWAKENLTPAAEKATAGQAYTAEEGYYLFLTDPNTLGTSALATLPIWLPLGGSTTTVEEKTASVSVTKQVKEGASWKAYADAEIGEAVQFRIQAKVPANYNGFDAFKVAFADAMPAGMTLDKGSVKVFVGNESGDDVTGSFTNVSTEQNLSMSCENTKNIAQIAPDSTITVTYTASLNANATTGNAGAVAGNASATTFTYSSDPQVAATVGTATSELVELYTYQASLDKMDKVTNVPLAGAEFVIKNDAGSYLSADGTWTANDKTAQVFTTDDQGAISGIKGLDAGTYAIVETKAPEGYSLPANTSISLKVTPTYGTDGRLTGLTCETTSDFASPDGTNPADPASGMVNLDVKNDKQFALAVTGAAGVGMGGAVVLAIGLGWYVARAHRKNAEQ